MKSIEFKFKQFNLQSQHSSLSSEMKDSRSTGFRVRSDRRRGRAQIRCARRIRDSFHSEESGVDTECGSGSPSSEGQGCIGTEG